MIDFKKKYKNISILMVTFCFILISIPILNLVCIEINDVHNTDSQFEKQMTNLQINWYNNNAEPIYIDGQAKGIGAHNWTWARMQEWCRSGDGSYSNPYVIENLTIDCEQQYSGIVINNSKNVYFKISNCTLKNSGLSKAGIFIENTQNGTLTGNNCSNNMYGIYLNACMNLTISNNFVMNNTECGIYLSSCKNGSILDNSATLNRIGIDLDETDNITVNYNRISENTYQGLGISKSNYSYVLKNIIEDNRYGIFLVYGFNNSFQENNMTDCGFFLHGSIDELSSQNISKSNKVNNRSVYFYKNEKKLGFANFSNGGQILLVNCSASSVAHLNTSSCTTGILLISCYNNTISHNTVNNNMFGIHTAYCDNLTISNNELEGNSYATYFNYAENYTIYDNTLNDNVNGITLFHIDNAIISTNYITQSAIGINSMSGENINIKDNTLLNDEIGISLSNCFNSSVIENNLNFNDKAIFLHDSNRNNITDNDISFNDIGIHLENSNKTLVTQNVLIGDINNCIKDEGFNNSIYGNNCQEGDNINDNDNNDKENENKDLSNDLTIVIIIGIIFVIGLSILFAYILKKRKEQLTRIINDVSS